MEKDNLKLIVLKSIEELGFSIDEKLKKMKGTSESHIVPVKQDRFSNGEGKVVIDESVRGKDVYILADVGNHSITYPMHGFDNRYSPDDHFRDIQRTITAIKRHAEKITVIMPLLYSSRQHRRKSRESLDCAIALQELVHFYGVDNIITIDVHDPEIVNALPLNCIENIYPTGLILNEFFKNELSNIDFNNLIVIAPDTGATERAQFYANIFKCPLGMFYKQRDYTTVKGGENEIKTHFYAGPDVTGKDVLVVDDMISSGHSLLDITSQFEKMKPNNLYFIAPFSLFANGITKFDKAYNEGKFTKLYTTNFTYFDPSIKEKEWIKVVDGSDLLARIIYSLHKNQSISSLVDEKAEVAKNIEGVKLLLTKNGH